MAYAQWLAQQPITEWRTGHSMFMQGVIAMGFAGDALVGLREQVNDLFAIEMDRRMGAANLRNEVGGQLLTIPPRSQAPLHTAVAILNALWPQVVGMDRAQDMVLKVDVAERLRGQPFVRAFDIISNFKP